MSWLAGELAVVMCVVSGQEGGRGFLESVEGRRGEREGGGCCHIVRETAGG